MMITHSLVELGNAAAVRIPAAVATVIYAVAVGVIVLATGAALRRLRTNGGDGSQRTGIFLFCMAYAIILPRFPDYSYILLLVPTYVLLRETDISGVVPLFVLASLPVTGCRLPGGGAWLMAFRYYPLLLAFAVWGLYLRLAFGRRGLACCASPASRRSVG